MNKEGEFKKRIMELAAKAEKQMGSHLLFPELKGWGAMFPVSNVHRELFDYRDSMTYVVDEAKKEFSPYFNFLKYILSRTPVPSTPQEINETYREYAAEIIVKLKKFFGELEK